MLLLGRQDISKKGGRSLKGSKKREKKSSNSRRSTSGKSPKRKKKPVLDIKSEENLNNLSKREPGTEDAKKCPAVGFGS